MNGSLLAGAEIRLKSRPRDMSLGIAASSAALLVWVEGVEVAVGRRGLGSLEVRGEIGNSSRGGNDSPAEGGSSLGIRLVSDVDVVCDKAAGEVVGVVCCGGPVEGAVC